MISVSGFVTAPVQGRLEQAIGSRLARIERASKVQSGVNKGLMARVHAATAKVSVYELLVEFCKV